jgi:hypothetical protein
MKKLSKITALFLVLFISFSFQTLNAKEQRSEDYRGKWVKLGKRRVSKGADHDVIMVTARKGTFRKLKFKVTRSAVHINSIKVVYANGTSELIHIKKNFRRGESSRVIDLKGNKRIIKKIVFNYHTKFFARGKARIHVYGKH